MRYLLIIILSLFLTSSGADAYKHWPNTSPKLILKCRDIKDKDTYGANEFIKDNKVCRWVLEVS